MGFSRLFSIGLAVIALGGLCHPTSGKDDIGHNSYRGKAAPELKSEKPLKRPAHWRFRFLSNTFRSWEPSLI